MIFLLCNLHHPFSFMFLSSSMSRARKQYLAINLLLDEAKYDYEELCTLRTVLSAEAKS